MIYICRSNRVTTVWMAVTENFGGWGISSVENTDGIKVRE
jgi:hypothetical protein